MNKKILITIAIVTSFAASLIGCQSIDSSRSEENTIKMVYVNWAEGIAMTNLAKVVLEDKMNYNVDLTMADVAPIFTSLASGDQDVFMDAWLPVTHESYMKEYGDELETIGTNFEGARIGLVVPEYMNIQSIDELNNWNSDLEGQIIGIDSGAGIMSTTEAAIETYGLSLSLLPGSGPAMTASLETAISKELPIVVTGWEPHWKFARWDLKFLEDPKGVFGESETIYTIARNNFSKDMPEAAKFFENFSMSSQELGDLMGAIADSSEDPEVVAREWMSSHPKRIASWLPAN